jgi:hypothetical protein
MQQSQNDSYNNTPQAVAIRNCPKCGKPTAAKYCGRCGTYVPETTPAAAYPNPAAPQPVPAYPYSPPPVTNVSHNGAFGSILVGVASLFIVWELSVLFGLILGIITVYWGFNTVKKKDNWGAIAVILGLISVIVGIIGFMLI